MKSTKCDICGCTLPDTEIEKSGKIRTIDWSKKKFHICDRCLLKGKPNKLKTCCDFE